MWPVKRPFGNKYTQELADDENIPEWIPHWTHTQDDVQIASDSLNKEVEHGLWSVKDAFLPRLFWQSRADLQGDNNFQFPTVDYRYQPQTLNGSKRDGGWFELVGTTKFFKEMNLAEIYMGHRVLRQTLTLIVRHVFFFF